MTTLEWRTEIIQRHKLYLRGMITLDLVYEAADSYIDAAKEHMRSKGKKFRAPSRAKIIRAFT